MLKLIEPFELHKKDFYDPERIHLMVQAKQISYHDRDRWLGDPTFTDMPMAQLLSDAYLDQRRMLINHEKALAWDQVPSYGSLRGDTVYIAVVDEQGQAVSLIHSLYGAFGSGVVSLDSGVVLQNRGAYFSLHDGHPNVLAPGKIPMRRSAAENTRISRLLCTLAPIRAITRARTKSSIPMTRKRKITKRDRASSVASDRLPNTRS